ncbi:MAG: hypothetical protein K8I27_16305 [Planctomycetes bacterium]|nr:hypothetical protein [Planctomycetota bacterium]
MRKAEKLARKLWILPMALVLLAMCHSPRRADAQGELAFELAALREAWLYGDDATAAARLDTLRADNRLSGEFPRWYASLRAVLALRAGDSKLALEALQPVLDGSKDARNYLRACRLLLAYGDHATALAVIRQGRERAPRSISLQRFEAGLLWLGGDHKGAIDAYVAMIAGADKAQYPFLNTPFTRWSEVRPWDADDAGKPASPDTGDPFGPPPPGEWKDEPYAGLFQPIHWFPSDLPGLDRCVHEIAADAALSEYWRARLPDLIKGAGEVQRELEDLRTGEPEVRQALEHKATRARWQAVIATRITATRQLAQDDLEAAESALKSGLGVAGDDLALLDLQAQLYGRTGRAEEARGGPLSRLRTLASIAIYPSTLYSGGPSAQVVDRVFLPALTLYRANPEAGLVQFDLMRTAFGDANRQQPVQAGVLGLWLYKQGEPDLARKLLVEAGRLSGHESGRPLYQDALYVEMALLAMGEGQVEGTDDEEAERPAPPPGGDEVDPVEIARLDANTNPLLRQSLRAGSVLSAIQDSRERIRVYMDVNLWGGYAGFDVLRGAGRFVSSDDALLREVLFEIPAKLATEVPDAELDAFLAADHATGTTLKEALDVLAESLKDLRTNNNWNVRRVVSERTGPVLGMVEARVLLLRAKLLKQRPATLAELKTWLDTWQGQVDLRARLGAQPSEIYTRFADARKQGGVPEIVHTGLALDAARLLARAGHHADAAKLLWLNRDAMMGIESTQRMLTLAGVLARKGGDMTLATRCRLAGASASPNPLTSAGMNLPLLITELPLTRADLLEFGDAGDVENMLENQIIPYADSNTMHALYVAAPELKNARPTLFMRNTSRTGTEGIFATSVSSGSCVVIWRNWAKMMVSPDTWQNCHRFAAWVITSDLPVVLSRSSYNGLATTQDAIMGWAMLNELWKKQGANNPEALLGAERLSKLLDRTAAQPGHKFDIYSDWWT